MKMSLLIAVLLVPITAQAQNPEPKFFAVNLPLDGSTPNKVRFLCSQDYDKAECLKDVSALRKALAPYPLQLLEQWSYYLVSSEGWKPLARSHGGNGCSVAFTMLLGRATVLDQRLLSPAADRNVELQRCGAVTGPALLDLAVTHELGHALCQEKNERKADDYGKALRDGKIPVCGKTPEQPGSEPQSVAAARRERKPEMRKLDPRLGLGIRPSHHQHAVTDVQLSDR